MASLTSSTPANDKTISSSIINFPAAFNSGSIFVKFLCTAVCIGYLLSFSRTALDLFAVSPGYMVPPNFWIWTLATHALIEAHCWVVVWDIVAAVFFGKYFEPLWSRLEIIRFFAIATIIPAVLTTATYLVMYLAARDTDLLFQSHIHGLAAFVAAFTVALKQMEPDSVLFNSPFGKLRRRHVPLSLLAISIPLRIMHIVDPPFPILFTWGFIISWIYLRFYQSHTGGRRGDMADSFSFASFFPDSVHPFVAILSNSVYAILVSARVCSKVTRKYEVTPQTPVIVTLPGTGIQDAERRRQLALKALNERLSRVPAAAAWPTMDEDNDAAPQRPHSPAATPLPKPLQISTTGPGGETSSNIVDMSAVSPASSNLSDNLNEL